MRAPAAALAVSIAWLATGCDARAQNMPSASAPAPLAPDLEASPNLVPRADIVATLRGSPAFTILAKALEAANLSVIIASTPELTLFAPTDIAFQALPAGELAALLLPSNAALLQKVLTYHLVHLDLDTARLKGAKGSVQSVENAQLEIDGIGTSLKVNDANIIQADVKTRNGDIIQALDKVLIPPDVTIPTAAADAGAEHLD